MSYSDPLGIQSAIDKMQEWHKLNPITEEMAEDWNNHPVTKRLKQYIQIDLQYRLRQTTEPASAELLAVYDYVLEFPVAEVVDDKNN